MCNIPSHTAVEVSVRKRQTKVKPQYSNSTDFPVATKTILWGSFNEITKQSAPWELKIGKDVVALSLFFFLLPQCATLWPCSCTKEVWYKYPKSFRNFAVSQRDVITNWASWTNDTVLFKLALDCPVNLWMLWRDLHLRLHWRSKVCLGPSSTVGTKTEKKWGAKRAKRAKR